MSYKVLLMGGCGNNLFQVARALSIKNKGASATLMRLPPYGIRAFRLTGLSIHDDWLDVDQFAGKNRVDLEYASVFDMFQLALIYILRRIGLNFFFDRPLAAIVRRDGPFSKFRVIDAGYFQGREHLDLGSVRTVAKRLAASIGANRSTYDAVAHVRGGDSVERDRLGQSDFERFIRYCASASLDLSLVTDDPAYISRMCSEFQCDVPKIRGGAPGDDFAILCAAKNIFMSNSTFSFWAGLVGREVMKSRVFAPRSWTFGHFLDAESI